MRLGLGVFIDQFVESWAGWLYSNQGWECHSTGHACCACERQHKTFPVRWTRAWISSSHCWVNVSHWSTAYLRTLIFTSEHWYQLLNISLEPVQLLNSGMHLLTLSSLLMLITNSTFIISRSFRCVGLNWQGLFLIILFLTRPSHLEVY